MDVFPPRIIFIVGMCAPASLYADYIKDLQARLPQAEISTLQWWDQENFGVDELDAAIDKTEVILIAHSAGSVLALQALEKRPYYVKKIIMLDSHFNRSSGVLPSVDRMLDILMNKDNLTTPSIEAKVRQAYAPVLASDAVFTEASTFAIEWVQKNFDHACSRLSVMSAHSALYLGFTNPAYQLLNEEDDAALHALWDKFNVEVKCLPRNHFDLIDPQSAADINQVIAHWLYTG